VEDEIGLARICDGGKSGGVTHITTAVAHS
jgi:hypothetical protein